MFSPTLRSTLLALACLLAGIGAAQAEIYKCSSGSATVFSDKPCPSSEKSQVLEEKQVQTVPAPKIVVSATATPTPTVSATATPDPTASPQPEKRCFKNKNGHTFCNTNPVQ